MTLRGCLWHEGSNGLGVGPMWLRRWLPYRERFDAAARVHDACYDIKGDGRDRFLYDKHLLEMMMRVSESDVEGLFSIVYYVMVRAFGWAFYRYDKPLHSSDLQNQARKTRISDLSEISETDNG